MAALPLTARVTISDRVVHQKVDEEVVLLNLDTGVYHGLGPTGARLWELLLEDESLQRVFERMLTEYDVGAGQLQDDILRLVQELETHNLVTVAAQST